MASPQASRLEAKERNRDDPGSEELGIEMSHEPRTEHVGLLEEEGEREEEELEEEEEEPTPPRRRGSHERRRHAAVAAIGDPFECVCTLLRVPKVIGRNYILFQRPGCLVTVGPHWSGLLFTIGLILTATFYFVKNVCSPSITATCIAVAFCILSLGFLLLTGCSNPGFVTTSVPESQARRKYCDRCHIYTAPGTAHCQDCDCCVEQLDHHCPWTGHCIGRRNMSYFVSFNCSWICYVIFVFAMLLTQNKLFD